MTDVRTTDPLMRYAESASGLILPREIVEDQIRAAQRPTALDICCGAGGMSLGIMHAGFRVVAGIDYDALCAQTYMANLGAYPCQFYFVEEADRERMEKVLRPKGNGIATMSVSGSGWISGHPEVPGVECFFLGDMRRLTGAQILDAIDMERGELDLVCGGPPCQGFSRAGKQDVMDPRNSLVFEFCRLVCELQPKTMAMENVPGMLSMVTPDGLPVMDVICRILEDGDFAGYDAFRASLKAQQGTLGLMRSRPKKSEPQSEPGAAPAPGQSDLFAEEAVA